MKYQTYTDLDSENESLRVQILNLESQIKEKDNEIRHLKRSKGNFKMLLRNLRESNK